MSMQAEVTRILEGLRSGDRQATRRLLPLVYDQLRALAQQHLHHERADHTLEATALVHEAFLKLVGQENADYRDRAHFFAVAAEAMRRILVDYARGHRAAKRGGDRCKLSLEELSTIGAPADTDLLAVDEALTRLSEFDPLQGKIVELRFFGGLTIEEVAAVMGLSVSKVKREWRTAQAWLYREVTSES